MMRPMKLSTYLAETKRESLVALRDAPRNTRKLRSNRPTQTSK